MAQETTQAWQDTQKSDEKTTETVLFTFNKDF